MGLNQNESKLSPTFQCLRTGKLQIPLIQTGIFGLILQSTGRAPSLKIHKKGSLSLSVLRRFLTSSGMKDINLIPARTQEIAKIIFKEGSLLPEY